MKIRMLYACAVFMSLVFFNQALGIIKVVDTQNRICKAEKDYIDKRTDSVSAALCNFAGESAPVLPRLAFLFSGGGYRAMIASAGFSQAMADMGLWNAATYLTCLSGSTWFLGSFLMRDCRAKGHLSFQDYYSKLKGNVVGVNFFNPSTIHWDIIAAKILEIYATTGSVQPADLWGAVLADRLLSDVCVQGQDINFSDIQTLLKNNPFKYPYPIFTSSLVNKLAYHWIEVNPFAAGGDMLMNGCRGTYHGAYIPSIYLGSIFQDRELQEVHPEMTTASLIGICGSPYSLSFYDIIKFVLQHINAYVDSETFKKIEGAVLTWIWMNCQDGLQAINRLRFLPTNVNNMTYGMSGAVFEGNETVWLSDAGEINNLPFTPLLDTEKREGVARNINMIIVCDASANAGEGDREMVVARNQIFRLGLWGSIPELTDCNWINDNLCVFKNSDPSVPTIIYFSLPIDAHQPTLRFDYTSDQFDLVYGSMYSLVDAGKQCIQNEIKDKISKLNPSFGN